MKGVGIRQTVLWPMTFVIVVAFVVFVGSLMTFLGVC
jgi:hypothetical protein